MTLVLFKDATGAECAPRLTLPPGRRKVSTIVRKHVRRDVPFMVSIHKPWAPLAPCDDTVLFRKRKDVGDRTFEKTFPEPGDTLVVTYLPRGGRGGQTAMKIAVTVASLALMFANPAAGLGLISANTALAIQTTAALVIAGSAIASIFQRPKTSTPIYGVQGGGNLPRPNQPIPVGYGRCWRVPELAQPDYSRFENREDTILFKRVVIGQGNYRLKTIRVGTTTFWSGDIAPNGGVITSGITSPFPGCRFEFINGQVSTLVPSNVITSPNVTGQVIPLSTEPNPIVGPFVVSPVGVNVNRLQVDFSTPNGYSRNSHETTQDLWFEYAPIDDAGSPTGAWQTLYRITGNFFADKHLRFSQSIVVPDGRYAVRVRNNRPKISDGDNCNYSWDGLRGYQADPVVRAGITELAMEIRSSKGLGVTSFSDVQVEVERWGLVWNGSSFVEGIIRKCVDCYVDVITNTAYGLGENPELVDLGKVHAYRTGVPQFDTFDGFINGPVSAWDAANTVLLPLRAEPTRLGGGYSFTRDEPTALRRHIFTRRQIVKGSTRVRYKPQADDGSAHHIIKFDDGGDYRRPNSAEAYIASASRTPISMRVEGISSYEHAMHIARWLSAAAFYRRKTVSFSTEMDGRLVKRGDAVGVDVWFVNATNVAGVRALSGTTLTLDADMAIAAGHHAVLRDRKGREWGPIPVTQGATLREIVLDPTACALEQADTGLSLAQVIGSGNGDRCAVRVGLPARLGEQFLVRTIAPQSKGRVALDALVDSAQVYAEIDAEIPPDSPLTWGLIPKEAPEVVSLSAGVYQHGTVLRARWSISAEAGAEVYQVQIAYGSSAGPWEPAYEGRVPVGSAPVQYLSTGASIYIRARAFGPTGVPGGWKVSEPFTTPKPIVIATGAEPQTIDFDAHVQEVRAAISEAVGQAKKAFDDEIRVMRMVIQDLEEQVASNRFIETKRVESVRDTGVARLREAENVLAEADRAAAERLEGLEASVNNPSTGLVATRASLVSFQSTQATFNSATSSSLLSLAASLTALDGTVSGNSSAISVLQASVVTINGTITSQATQITSLQSGLATANSNITANATAIGTLTTRVTSAEGSITSQSGQITSLTNSLTTTNGTVAANSSAISTLQSNVSSINGTLSSYASQLTTLNAQVGSLNSSVTTIANATVNPSGTSALWAVQLNAAGRVSGVRSFNNGAVATFGVSADIFTINRPSDGATVVGWDGINGVLSIFGATLVAGVVSSPTASTVLDLNNNTFEMFD